MKFSIVVTTYNRAKYLCLCLPGYLRQNAGGFEIIVSDDGSTDRTPEVMERFAQMAPFPCAYLQQADEGHRRARAINRAVAAARGDWLLFTDCDCIPRHDLVKVHRREAERGRLLCGGRVLLNQEETSQLTPQAVVRGKHEHFLTGGRKFRLWVQHLKNQYYVLIRKKRRPHNYAVNMSCAPEDMKRVNGYDHNFQGWGNADGDLRDRMRQAGIQPKSVFARAVIFHQRHDPDPTMPERRNKAYARRPNIPAFCKKGLGEVEGTVKSLDGGFSPDRRPPARDLDLPLGEIAVRMRQEAFSVPEGN